MRKTIPSVKIVKSRGNLYYYFRTGIKNENGNEILRKLPDYKDPSFGSVYASYTGTKKRKKTNRHVVTVGKLVEMWQRSDKYQNLKPATQKSYNIYAKTLIEKLEEAPALEVEPRDITYIMAHMPKGSANVFKGLVGSIYAWARKNYHVPHECDPTADIEVNETGSHEPWPINILKAALSHESDRLRLSVALMYYTGQRIGDVCNMKWTDFKDGYFYVKQQKTGIELKVAIHPTLQKELAKCQKHIGNIICHKWNGKPISHQVIRREIKKFGDDNNIELVPHGLRKNAVITLLESGCTVEEVHSVTGQSRQMIEYYSKGINRQTLSEHAINKWSGNKA